MNIHQNIYPITALWVQCHLVHIDTDTQENLQHESIPSLMLLHPSLSKARIQEILKNRLGLKKTVHIQRNTLQLQNFCDNDMKIDAKTTVVNILV